MPTPIRWLLSLVFVVQMYLAMAVLAVVFAPFALLSRNAAFLACHSFCRWVIFTARLLCGLRSEVRGVPPTDEVVVAAKHQSFFDIILIFHAVPRGKFIMKRELMYAPFLGQYALRIGCVPVDRGKRGAAIAKMKADVARGAVSPGQLIIYPQGTRVPPGEKRPYKVGTGLLYDQLGQPCVPVATMDSRRMGPPISMISMAGKGSSAAAMAGAWVTMVQARPGGRRAISARWVVPPSISTIWPGRIITSLRICSAARPWWVGSTYR